MPDSGDFSIGSNRWPGISKLIEECNEVGQVCGKLIGSSGEIMHWDGTNLKDRLEGELGDVLAAIDFVSQYCGLNKVRIADRRAFKFARFRRWQKNPIPVPKMPTAAKAVPPPGTPDGNDGAVWGEDGIWSKDGKTYLSCGFAMVGPECKCNGCKWERDELPQYSSLDEAMKDRSEERQNK
jgi:NTP pyrophosphatase (non-canonical NTP hydrolase)